MIFDSAAEAFAEFVRVVKALRTPGTGCPWDLEQTHRTLRPYLIEEAYEVLEALDAGADAPLCEELGDLLLQVVLHAQLAADREAFTIADVVRGITAKMVRRHPHVFGDKRMNSATEVTQHWERTKAEERAGAETGAAGLERLPAGLPALARAQRLGEKAARARADVTVAETIEQARKHLDALERQTFAAGIAPELLDENLGDLLFHLSQAARKLEVSAEDSLRAAGLRFIERFREDR